MVIPVRVVPRAGATRLAGVRRGALLVRLAAAPVEGAANDALVRLLADRLGVARGRVIVRSGPRSRDKRILVEDIGPAAVLAALGPLEPTD